LNVSVLTVLSVKFLGEGDFLILLRVTNKQLNYHCNAAFTTHTGACLKGGFQATLVRGF